MKDDALDENGLTEDEQAKLAIVDLMMSRDADNSSFFDN
jgi:hypothetical protein